MIKGIGHLGIAVEDIEKSVAAIAKALDMEMPEIHDNQEKKIKFSAIDLDGLGLKFIQDYSDDGEFARFVKPYIGSHKSPVATKPESKSKQPCCGFFMAGNHQRCSTATI